MRNVKKVFGYLALAAVVVLACLELAHWGDTRVDLVSENAEMILRLEPVTAITEEERTMMDALSAHPAVQELLEDEAGGIAVSENSEVMTIVEGCLGSEKAGLSTVSMLTYEEGPALILSWSGDRGRTLLQRLEDGNGAEYFKCCSRNGFLGTKALYENWDNEKVHWSAAHHWWFSWLTADW